MKNKISIKPEIYVWAIERSCKDMAEMRERFPKLDSWIIGDQAPTLKQLEDFARYVYIPLGYLFLEQPLSEPLPITDFRSLSSKRPSPNLLDTIYICQQRQEWYRDYVQRNSLQPLEFTGRFSVSSNIMETARYIRSLLDFPLEEQKHSPNREAVMRKLIAKIEDAGVLVMINGIVGGDTHRPLSVEEFRGFALVDPLASLIFINGRDSKAGQLFTLIHEFAHILLGQSGISNSEARILPHNEIEIWCNKVAAEFLMPMDVVKETFKEGAPLINEIKHLAKLFKVSELVAARRLFDAGFLPDDQFQELYVKQLGINRASGTGGNFYKSFLNRSGRRFARAVITSALEGETLFREAFMLLGVSQNKTFFEAARQLGINP